MEKIIIIMVTDENYILPTKVAVFSLLTSDHSFSFFEVHILCRKGMNFDSREQLKALERIHDNLEIRFHEIEDNIKGENHGPYSYCLLLPTLYQPHN